LGGDICWKDTTWKTRHIWEGNVKMCPKEVGCRGIDWIDVAEDKVQVAGTWVCGNEPSGSIKFGEFLD
jgi:hypothetical protein